MIPHATGSTYARDGFSVVDEPIVSNDLVRAAVDGMHRLRRGEYRTGRGPEPSPWNPGDDPRSLVKIEMPQLADPAIAALVSDPGIGETVAGLTGARWLQVFWVQLLDKPSEDPDVPARVGWHQDWHYWRDHWEEGSELLTAWVAVTDVDEASGPLTYVPGSQNLGLVPGGDFFSQSELRDRLELPTDAEWSEVPALVPAGGLAVHDRMTLHGSGANRSGRPRRSFAIHLRTENSRPTVAGREGLARHIDDLDACPVIFGPREIR